MENKWKDVSKDEFKDFIHSYPRNLIVDACAIVEPPILIYYDRLIGQSVAKHEYDDIGENSKHTYSILENVAEVTANKDLDLRKFREKQEEITVAQLIEWLSQFPNDAVVKNWNQHNVESVTFGAYGKMESSADGGMKVVPEERVILKFYDF